MEHERQKGFRERGARQRRSKYRYEDNDHQQRGAMTGLRDSKYRNPGLRSKNDIGSSDFNTAVGDFEGDSNHQNHEVAVRQFTRPRQLTSEDKRNTNRSRKIVANNSLGTIDTRDYRDNLNAAGDLVFEDT